VPPDYVPPPATVAPEVSTPTPVPAPAPRQYEAGARAARGGSIHKREKGGKEHKPLRKAEGGRARKNEDRDEDHDDD
jgi:hypothetical protein